MSKENARDGGFRIYFHFCFEQFEALLNHTHRQGLLSHHFGTHPVAERHHARQLLKDPGALAVARGRPLMV